MGSPCGTCGSGWWLGAELNRRHKDFQSSALPTELPSRANAANIQRRRSLLGKAISFRKFVTQGQPWLKCAPLTTLWSSG
jgi:hypothetical protein